MTELIGERNSEFVRALYAATSGADWEKVQTMVTDDFCVIEADCLPFGGVFRGIPGLQRLYPLVMGSIGVTAIDILDLIGGADRVAVFVEFKLEHSDVKIALVETFRFRDGKVYEIKPYYFDHAPIWDAYNARKQAGAAS